MPGDKRFYERLSRIEKGKTWVPDGVVHDSHYKKKRKPRGSSAWPSILMVLAVPAALAIAGPEALPAELLGFFQAPTTEAAMASLGQWTPLANLSP